MRTTWLAEHRGWEDWCSAAVGLATILSPVIAGVTVDPVMSISVGLAGVLIAALAMLELMSLSRWEEWAELVCGAWLIASPLVLGYGGTLRVLHFAFGAAVIVLALLELWQDRNRRFDV
jgi:hypothetical protein